MIGTSNPLLRTASQVGKRLARCLLPGMLLAGSWTAAGQSGSEEYQVKAAFLFHFAELVDWPADPDSVHKKNITFCTFDDDLARQEIQNTVDGKKVGARTFRFLDLHGSLDPAGCDVLFLGRTEARRQASTLKLLQGEPVLTVGEADNFFQDGGMIRFHLDAGRVRFDINVVAAEQSRVKISSRLLLLASYVLRNSPEIVGGK